MPLEVAIVSRITAGFRGLEEVAARMDPRLTVRLEFDGACVAVRDPDMQVVAVVQRPKAIGWRGDIARCLDQSTGVADDLRTWTEGSVPFHATHQGLTFLAGLALATDGRMFVKGAVE